MKLVVRETIKTKTPEKKKKKRERTRKKLGSMTMHPFVIGRANPFLSAVNGVRSPDEFGYPTATALIRFSTTMITGASGYDARLFFPFTAPIVYAPASITVGGTITWGGGTSTNAQQQTNLTNLAGAVRTVVAGLRITADSSLTTSSGHIWIAHFPYVVNANTPYNQAPPNEQSFAALPLAEKFSVVELAERPIIVPFRPYDDGVYRFRAPAAMSDTAEPVESTPGWCTIGIFISGAASGVALNIEVIQHLEYIQRADTLYGFVDSLPGVYSPQAMVQASQVDAEMPVGVLETVVSGVEQTADFVGRMSSAINKAGPALLAMGQFAGKMAGRRGFFHTVRDVPALDWPDEKW